MNPPKTILKSIYRRPALWSQHRCGPERRCGPRSRAQMIEVLSYKFIIILRTIYIIIVYMYINYK